MNELLNQHSVLKLPKEMVDAKVAMMLEAIFMQREEPRQQTTITTECAMRLWAYDNRNPYNRYFPSTSHIC